jgi:hypothetical protein
MNNKFTPFTAPPQKKKQALHHTEIHSTVEAMVGKEKCIYQEKHRIAKEIF